MKVIGRKRDILLNIGSRRSMVGLQYNGAWFCTTKGFLHLYQRSSHKRKGFVYKVLFLLFLV